MNPKLQLFIRLLAIILVIFFAIQPFNWFCQISGQCRPILISYYFPKTIGTRSMEVKAEIVNYNKNLIFSTLEPSIKVFGNEKKTITYRAKNLSRKTIKIQPHLIIDPEYTEEYITRYECLCSRSYRLKPQEEIELKMEFEISEDIFRNPKFDKANPITIRYKIESLNTAL